MATKSKANNPDAMRRERKLIIIDVGGVILDYNDRAHYSKMANNVGVAPALFVPAVFELILRMELGTLTVKDGERILAKKFGVNASDIKMEKEFAKSSKPNRRVLELVNKLYADYRIAIASNINVGNYKVIFGKDGILKELKYDKMFASCYMGILKPAPAYYKFILRSMKAKPVDAIFIDDREPNIVAAQRLGIRSIRFTDSESLIRDLHKFLRSN